MVASQGEQQPTATRHQRFRSSFSTSNRRRMSKVEQEEGEHATDIRVMYVGIAAAVKSGKSIEVGISINDDTYSIDFSLARLDTKGVSTRAAISSLVSNYVITELTKFQNEHMCKFLGAGVTEQVVEELSPELCPKLWQKLDIVPMAFAVGAEYTHKASFMKPHSNDVDEQADSMARKCVMFFGPNQQPRVQVGYRNEVEVDASGHARLTQLSDYKATVGERTWDATMKYAQDLKDRNMKIAFFNSTPQGGGVALMRHALVRFLRLMDIDVKWYVPKPRPQVFRITKTNHNILQGVADPAARMSESEADQLSDWIQTNAERYWLSEGGPLGPRSEGGADVIIIDDPQMPGLVPLAKKADPDRPVIFRSHIQIRSDLVAQKGSAASEVWNYLWDRAQQADVFISHPVREFVPHNVEDAKVGYMPATTDWLDGLNKDMSYWDMRFYIHQFNLECDARKMVKLDVPNRDYIIQVARFDPAKGIPDVIKAYGHLRRHYFKGLPSHLCPQLVICGPGAVDDPDGTMIYDQTMEQLETEYPDIIGDVVVMRLGPSDQELDALMSASKVALQLSTREGFEVKVSEAIHKGKPIIATKRGGIPLQVEHGKSGFLVESGDYEQVAKYMHDLLTDDELYQTMSAYAKTACSDEVSTVGNAVSWLYLASVMSQGKKIDPNGRWINDMAREYAHEPYADDEKRLPRAKALNLD
ncbi:MAG: hypothetical protein M1819_005703 [Sarea resinae]|nr:MAG: hypothetical protein M1819_005703 [Sarea resinae]